ncbi:MAG: response regulator [Treponema sp.]|jgi:putative two-component system response regulator|nr:response regulator [Treponema sp.]
MAEKKIILAVDDMPENLMQLGSLLEDYFDVRLAKSADMALNLLSGIKVDLILLDIVMPEMSGFEFLNLLRTRESPNKKTPIIFITAHADIDIIGKAISLGARDYIVKPIKADMLYKKIDSVIGIPQHIPSIIESKLKQLATAVTAANKVQAESLVKELLGLARGIPLVNNSMEEIAKLINDFEYEQVLNKVSILLHTLELYKT